MAPRGMCGSAPARAARSLPQRSPCGTRVGGTMYPRQARLRLHAAVPPRGSRSANRCFRDLLRAFARPCRCPLPAAFCAESAAPAPPAAKAPGCRGSRQRREIILSGLGDFRQHQRARLHAGSAHIGYAVNLGSLKPDPADMQTGPLAVRSVHQNIKAFALVSAQNLLADLLLQRHDFVTPRAAGSFRT